MVCPNIIEDLDIQPADRVASAISITTANGTSDYKECYNIKNLSITPLNGDASISIECARTSSIPNVLSDVPTPQEVSCIPGLSHLADKFPTKEEWPTIILIGRDCIQAQSHTQTALSDDKCQMAILTPLGWTILGKPAQSTRPLAKPHSCRSFMAEVSATPQRQHSKRMIGNRGFGQRRPNFRRLPKATTTPTTTPKVSIARDLKLSPKLKAMEETAGSAASQSSNACLHNNGFTENMPSDAKAQQFTQQYLAENEQLTQTVQGRKEDELPGYSHDERAFLNQVVRGIKSVRIV